MDEPMVELREGGCDALSAILTMVSVSSRTRQERPTKNMPVSDSQPQN